MTGDLRALLFGTLLAVAALAFVLYPLFFGVPERRRRRPSAEASEESPIAALREIEFDRATGKLSDADYAELKRKYAQLALTELRATSGAAAASSPADPIEARLLEYRQAHRECPVCGVRPEPDAIYCSTCGGYLPGVCPSCAAGIAEPAAAFCSRCGAALAPRAAAALA